jgi:predicted Fe-Mo cluster-binding NifX family protein
MKIAVPTNEGMLCSHFGHCEKFAIIDVADNKIVKEVYLKPPPHEPGSFPAWLKEQGVNMIIAGGMGQRAISLFQSNNIEVIVGATPQPAGILVYSYLEGKLKSGKNICDH